MRILVIEDNQDIAANLGDFLEDRGHTVDFAADGITGLHLAVVHEFDAIVLDLNLPGLDGLRQADFVVLGQQRVLPDVGEVETDEVFVVTVDAIFGHVWLP